MYFQKYVLHNVLGNYYSSFVIFCTIESGQQTLFLCLHKRNKHIAQYTDFNLVLDIQDYKEIMSSC